MRAFSALLILSFIDACNYDEYPEENFDAIETPMLSLSQRDTFADMDAILGRNVS
jgi:hypothetical protein